MREHMPIWARVWQALKAASLGGRAHEPAASWLRGVCSRGTGMIRSNSAPARSGSKSPRPSYLCNSGARGHPVQEESERDRKVPVLSHLHPTKCGFPGTLYSPFDYVTPIYHSMSRLHDRVYGSGMRRLVQRDERQRIRDMMASGGAAGSAASYTFGRTTSVDSLDPEIDQYSSFVAPLRPAPVKPGCLCENCGSNQPSEIRVDDAGYSVCEACGAQGSKFSYGVDYKEINDTDRSTARADAPRREAIGIMRIKEPAASTVVSTDARRKMKLGHAPEMASSAAEDNMAALNKGNQRRLKSLIEAIDKLFEELGQVDASVKRKIRMDAMSVFCASVAHGRVCKKKECQKALLNKPMRVVARESISFTMDSLSSGEGIDGVSKQTIVTLQSRVNSSPAFSHRDNATQHQSCHAMISALTSDNNSVECPSVHEGGPLKTPERKGDGRPDDRLPIARQDSDVQSSPIVQMRDAISRLSVEYSIPSYLRDSALCVLQDGNFVRQITENPIVSTKKTHRASAYVILRSVAEECGRADSYATEDHCRRVGLAGVDLAPIVSRVRSILPKSALGGCVNDDDELY